MSVVASLKKLVDALEEQSENISAYLDRETGSVELLSRESLSRAENEPESIDSLQDWAREELELSIQVTNNPERYLQLPDRFEIHEWQIMRDFSYQVKSEQARAALANAIRGKGAFRSFKNEIAKLNLWDAWDQFMHAALVQIARKWCETNNVTADTMKGTSSMQGMKDA